MESPKQSLQFTPDQQVAFGRVARLARNVGYFILATSLFSLTVAIVEAVISMPAGRMDDLVAWFSSFFNGNRSIDPHWFYELLIEVPFGILIGWGLIRFSQAWFTLVEQTDRHSESLFNGLERLTRVLKIAYFRAIALTIFIWLILIFT